MVVALIEQFDEARDCGNIILSITVDYHDSVVSLVEDIRESHAHLGAELALTCFSQYGTNINSF